LQAGPDPIGYDIASIGDYQLSGAVNAAWVAERWVLLEQIDGLDDALDDKTGRSRIFLCDIFSLVVQILQRLSQPLNLHQRPTCRGFY